MAKIIKETVSLLNSGIGPVSVTTTEMEKYDIDDYVQLTVKSKANYLKILTKANSTDPLDAENKPPVAIGPINVGGYHGS